MKSSVKHLTFEEIQIGKTYKIISYDNNKYDFVYVIDKIIEEDEFGEVPFIVYEFWDEHGKHITRQTESIFVERQPNCHTCGKVLFESHMEVCNVCNWIKCPDDNACGCNHKARK